MIAQLPSIVLASALIAPAFAAAPEKKAPMPVEIAQARIEQVIPRAWIPGSIVSREDARVAGITPGRVLWIAEVGQRVTAGTRLARLDDTLVKLRVADLQAQAARAKAQAGLAAAQADRFGRLAPTHVISDSQVEESRGQLNMAGADVARLTAQLHQAEYETQQAEIRAPFSGVVTERFVQRGEFLQPGAAVVRLVNTEEIEARATAALAYAGNVKAGQVLTVRMGGEERHGTVRAIVPVGDDRSRQFELRVVLPGPSWLVGTAVDVSVPTGEARTAVTIPRDALVIRQNRSYVMRVTPGNTVEERSVEPGNASAGTVEIRTGVLAGDRLVVRGAEGLVDGQPVAIVAPAAQTAQTPARPNAG